jgi:hypothetical protein
MRLQVMHLPAPPDQYPFALVIDECKSPPADRGQMEGLKHAIDARAVLVFSETVEVV